MSDTVNAALYKTVSQNIKVNLESINKLLRSCEISSKVATQETKITDFISINTDELIKDEAKADYYDLCQVAKIMEMLDLSKPEGKKKPMAKHFHNMGRSESTSSLASSASTHSNEDNGQATENVSAHLVGIRTSLESISNSMIRVPETNRIRNKETDRNEKFVDLVMKLQKLAKELQNISTSIGAEDAQQPEHLEIDGKLAEDIEHLSQVSLNILSDE